MRTLFDKRRYDRFRSPLFSTGSMGLVKTVSSERPIDSEYSRFASSALLLFDERNRGSIAS